jgi:hypothetical protein
MTERFVGAMRLLEACGQPGCPVCRCVTQDGRQHLDALLYEQVTDVETRRRLRGSGGFCNWHTWMLLEIHGSRSGAAIIYADLLGRLVESVRRDAVTPARTRSWLRTALPRSRFWRRLPRQTCPVCEDAAAAERRYLEGMLEGSADAELQLAYARSDGLCGPHMLQAAALAAEPPGRSWLAERTAAKWSRLRDDLARFVAKHDHRNREPFTAAEAAACERAFEVLSGARGVFGNDLHPPGS